MRQFALFFRVGPLLAVLSLALAAGAAGAAVPNPVPPPRPAGGATAGATPAPPPRPVGAPAPGTPSPAPAVRRDQWPTYLHDPRRTGGSAEYLLSAQTAPAIRPLGAVLTGGIIAAQAVIVDNLAYVGSSDGYFRALDATTGAVRWQRYLGRTHAPDCAPPDAGITSVAAVEGGIVYVGGGDRYFYALDAATGAFKWRVDTGNNDATAPDGGHYNWSSPLMIGGYVYIGVASFGDCPLVQGKLLRVDKATGVPAGGFDVVGADQVGGGIWTSPCFDARTNAILFTTGTADDTNGREPYAQAMVALDGATLAVRGAWRIPDDQTVPDSDWGTSCAVDPRGGLAFGTNKNGILYAFDPAQVAAGPVWQRRIAVGGACPSCDEGSLSTPAVADGTLYAAGNLTTIGGEECASSVRALDAATGAVRWEHCGSDVTYPALTYVNGLVLFGDGAVLAVLDAHSGATLASIATGGFIYAPPSVANGVIYLGSTDGVLYALGPPGAPAHWPAAATAARAAKPADPRLYPIRR